MPRVPLPSPGLVPKKVFDKFSPEYKAKLEALDEAKKKLMAKPGGLKIGCELLEKRRLEYGIIDDFFSCQPFDDKIHIFQVPRTTGETYDGGHIVMTGNRQKVEQETNPAGIITAAGAKAMDVLRDNGMDLGHMVSFLRIAPWRHEINRKGVVQEVLHFRVGDIAGSYDLMQDLRDGKTRLKFDEDAREHFYEDKDGKQWRPQNQDPFMSEDY